MLVTAIRSHSRVASEMVSILRNVKVAGQCGARTRRGAACQAKGDGRGGRCKFHGGKSTGPRTEAGRAKISAIQLARWERWRATKNERSLTRLYGLLGMLPPAGDAVGDPSLNPEAASASKSLPTKADSDPVSRQTVVASAAVQPRPLPVPQSGKVYSPYARAHIRRGSRG